MVQIHGIFNMKYNGFPASIVSSANFVTFHDVTVISIFLIKSVLLGV